MTPDLKTQKVSLQAPASCKLAQWTQVVVAGRVGTKHQIGSNRSLKISGHFWPILAFRGSNTVLHIVLASL